jgi:hypothetical protein
MADPSQPVLVGIAEPEDAEDEDEDGTGPAEPGQQSPAPAPQDRPNASVGQAPRRPAGPAGFGRLRARVVDGVQRLLGPGNRTRILGVGTALTILGALLVGFLADAAVVGKLRHDRDRQVAYASLRYNLANGTTPTGAFDVDGKPVAEGTPVALLEIGSIGLREVVRYGTTPADLMSGPGLRRDTVLPGQVGGSVIMGRRALYGGPFQYLNQLQAGLQFKVTTGQGESEFRVVDVRRPGDPIPPQLGQAKARLTLVTTSGNPYLPQDLLRVDAVLVNDDKALPTGSVAKPQPGDAALSTDRSAWMPLVLWGQALLLAAAAVTWLRLRWGGRQAWLVGSPVLLALGLAVADTAARLLPNVM